MAWRNSIVSRTGRTTARTRSRCVSWLSLNTEPDGGGLEQGLGLATQATLVADEDAVLEALLTADIDVTDIENDGGKITVFTPPADTFKAKQALADSFGEIDFEVDETQFLPKSVKTVTDDDVALLEKFLDMLNDLDDVQNVYHDAEF
jgi:transcriptional/translational regulatory protein YebC/TACO1